jgi:hypothetical protein
MKGYIDGLACAAEMPRSPIWKVDRGESVVERGPIFASG